MRIGLYPHKLFTLCDAQRGFPVMARYLNPYTDFGFKKRFGEEFANLSREQYQAYEQNLLDYWGVKAAVDTARAEGHAEGRAEGRVEGGAAVLLRQLGRRFGPLPDWVAPRLTAATPVQLEQWADRLLEAESLEAVFGDE